jgi:DNA-binding response OmpR family regulator
VAKRVLVIEDEENIMLSLTFVLEREGYEVSSARTGQEGLVQMRQKRPDLIILDLMLPDVSGYQVCEEARRDPGLADTPILVLTARAQEVERQKGIDVGATEYLTKPFRVAHLLARVASHLDGPQAAQRLPMPGSGALRDRDDRDLPA